MKVKLLIQLKLKALIHIKWFLGLLILVNFPSIRAQSIDSMYFFIPIDLNIKRSPEFVIYKNDKVYKFKSKLIGKDTINLRFLITINKDKSGNIIYNNELILKDSVFSQYIIVYGKMRKFFFYGFSWLDLTTIKEFHILKRNKKHIRKPISLWYRNLPLPILPSSLNRK